MISVLIIIRSCDGDERPQPLINRLRASGDLQCGRDFICVRQRKRRKAGQVTSIYDRRSLE